MLKSDQTAKTQALSAKSVGRLSGQAPPRPPDGRRGFSETPMHPLRSLLTPAVLAAAALTAAALTAAAASLRVEPSTRPTEWTIYHGAQKLLVYSFDPAKFKPYVKELYTLKGYNLLRDAPHDHLHHHALMYGIKVNGINFWEETPGCGVEKPIATPPPELGLGPGGQPEARLHEVIHWVAPEDAFLPDTTRVALLIERRTLTLTIDEAQQEVALAWKSEFQVGTKTNEVTLTGANYHGLGMRFLEELDPRAQHLNSGGQPDLSGTKQDVSQHQWGAVFFDAPGKPATVALFGHPSNARGDAQFFTMERPFAYISATQGLDKEPLIYHRGDTFALNYLVTLYPELKSADFLNRRAAQWRQFKP